MEQDSMEQDSLGQDFMEHSQTCRAPGTWEDKGSCPCLWHWDGSRIPWSRIFMEQDSMEQGFYGAGFLWSRIPWSRVFMEQGFYGTGFHGAFPDPQSTRGSVSPASFGQCLIPN